MFGFLSTKERQLSAAHKVLQHIVQTCDMPISIRLWDGSITPLGPNAAQTGLTVAIRSPGVVSALVRWPSLDHFVLYNRLKRVSSRCKMWKVGHGIT